MTKDELIVLKRKFGGVFARIRCNVTLRRRRLDGSSEIGAQRRLCRSCGQEFIPSFYTAVISLVHGLDRKSTRLNSSHQIISYAVFCLKKENKKDQETI